MQGLRTLPYTSVVQRYCLVCQRHLRKIYLWLILIVQRFSSSGSYRSHCLTPRCWNLWPVSSCIAKMPRIVFPSLSGLLINGSPKIPSCFTSSEMYVVWPFQDTHLRPGRRLDYAAYRTGVCDGGYITVTYVTFNGVRKPENGMLSMS